jgi:hypothetical protein
MSHILRFSVHGLLICVVTTSTIWAQATAQITGAVKDQAGIPAERVSSKPTSIIMWKWMTQMLSVLRTVSEKGRPSRKPGRNELLGTASEIAGEQDHDRVLAQMLLQFLFQARDDER